MPQYSYFCTFCNQEFQKRHSMKEKQEKCILCNEVGYVEKKFFNDLDVLEKTIKDKKEKTGDKIKKYINELQQEINDIKKERKE